MAGVKYPQPDGLVVDESRKQKWLTEYGYLSTDARFCDKDAFMALYLEEQPKSILGWIKDKTAGGFPMPGYFTCTNWVKAAKGEAPTGAKPQGIRVSSKPPVDDIDSQFEEWYAQECLAKKAAAYDRWLSENQEAIEQRALEKVRAELAAKRAKMAPQQPQEPQEPAETPLSGELLEPEGKGVSVSVAVDGAKGSKGAGIVGAIVDVPRK